MRNSVVLRGLQSSDEEAFLEGTKAWTNEDLSWYSFTWKPGMDFQALLERLDKNKKGIDLAKGHVPSTMLYGFVAEKIIGRVSIRHHLNDHLKQFGGHIGYAVLPNYRKMGYGKEMLVQAIEVCKKLELKELLITCASSNIPSVKMIEAVGGELTEEKYDLERKGMGRKYLLNI